MKHLRNIAELLVSIIFLTALSLYVFDMDETTMDYPFNHYHALTKAICFILIALVGFIVISRDLERIKSN